VVGLEHEKEQAVLLIGYRVGDLTNPCEPALDLIDEACSDMASRMFIRIREELGLAYSVGSTRMQGLEPGLVIFYASTSPENLDRVQEEMLEEITSLRREGLTKEEFDRAKASWLGREVIRLQGVRELAGSATINELVGLGWDNYRNEPDQIRALTQEQIQQAAEEWLAKDASVIIRLTNPEG
jgi:zinc protease